MAKKDNAREGEMTKAEDEELAKKEEVEYSFTAEAYDILDTARKRKDVARADQILMAEDGKIPPAPKGGWAYRPCRILKTSVEEDEITEKKTEYWDVEWTDEDGGKTKFCVTGNEKFIAELNSKSQLDSKIHEYEEGMNIDILDIFKSKSTGKRTEKWRKGKILATTQYYVRIHYTGWEPRWDEWLHVIQQGNRLAPYKEMTERALRARIARDKNFKKLMEERHELTVMNMQPDGSCLFRTVAHQVYGNANKHKKVRQECCDYLLKNKDRYEHFVMHYNVTFKQYVKGMRNFREWGGDPEIKAMEEIYDRPFEVYESVGDGDSTNPIQIHFGDLPEKDLEGVEPIRLSFHGSNHYNSVIPISLMEKMDSKGNFKPPAKQETSFIRDFRIQQIEEGEAEIARIREESKKKEEAERAEREAMQNAEQGENGKKKKGRKAKRPGSKISTKESLSNDSETSKRGGRESITKEKIGTD